MDRLEPLVWMLEWLVLFGSCKNSRIFTSIEARVSEYPSLLFSLVAPAVYPAIASPLNGKSCAPYTRFKVSCQAMQNICMLHIS